MDEIIKKKRCSNRKIRNEVCVLINGKNFNGPDMEGRKRGRRKCVREGRLLCVFV
jgi:hypothetical protein